MTSFLPRKHSNCKNCYKCIRHCSIKSIRFTNAEAHIIRDECILCGQCYVICPHEVKGIKNDIQLVKDMLGQNEMVIASLAPSFISNYNGAGIKSMEKALKKLGFYSAEETAIGATMVKEEYDNMLRTGEKDILISSCCNTINLLIQKHYPSTLQYLADIVSPMQAHCLDIKKRYPKAKTVFIGPCVSKKEEAERYEGIVDCVLTFEELTAWFNSESIELDIEQDSIEESLARFFPTTGGILKTMSCDVEKYTYIAIDGIDNCIKALKDIENNNISNCFIEMSACFGSCIGGPAMGKNNRSRIRDYQHIDSYAGTMDFKVENLIQDRIKIDRNPITLSKKEPDKIEISVILKQMGKTKPEHELNCGSCGYDTCRDKAIAVYQGKADTSMCLPFLSEKAESFSDTIIKNSPNGIIVLDDYLKVQQINKSARNIMNIRNESDVLGEQVVRILDPSLFMEVRQTGRGIHERRVYLAEYKKYIEQTIIYDRDYRILISIMRDVTNEETQKDRKEEFNRKTIDVADKVVEKQMRVVQEIALLLGETAAETKIALTKLKESIADE